MSNVTTLSRDHVIRFVRYVYELNKLENIKVQKNHSHAMFYIYSLNYDFVIEKLEQRCQKFDRIGVMPIYIFFVATLFFVGFFNNEQRDHFLIELKIFEDNKNCDNRNYR